MAVMGIVETVTVLTRRQEGEDEYGEPVWAFDRTVVENALVRQLDGEESRQAERPEGVDVEYVVCLPDVLSRSELDGATIALTQRGQKDDEAMRVRRVVHVPQSPLIWKFKVAIGRFDG